MSLSFCFATHPGVRRANNEDSCCVRPDLGLFVVADGVGGYDAGEVASHAAVTAIEEAVGETAGWTEQSAWPFDYQPALGVDGNRLNWAFHLANGRIRSEGEAGRGRQGMATTVAAVLFGRDPDGAGPATPGATIGHVGDSRIYRYRRGQLDRLTRDHSWVEEQVQAGLIPVGDARLHPRRNLLTRALTGGTDPIADLGWVPTAPGDSLLLCSDGLFAVLADEQIAEILKRHEGSQGEGTAQSDGAVGKEGRLAKRNSGRRCPGGAERDELPSDEADATVSDGTVSASNAKSADLARGDVCDALVHAANLAGGPDNITVILVRL